ncbi:hypothetical protein ACM66T_09845 [Sulfurimonas sp. ST-25]|uniref:hypothetical protein n=1 Tax=Sulfurimonas sp. ST-25 TaxID=3400151 RepID=UPI003A839B0D
MGWSTLAVPRTTSPLTGTFVGEFVKIGDMGSYVKQQDASVLEIQYSGRICVGVIADDQVIFELRVDDTPSSAGPARTMLQYGEEGVFLRIRRRSRGSSTASRPAAIPSVCGSEPSRPGWLSGRQMRCTILPTAVRIILSSKSSVRRKPAFSARLGSSGYTPK